MPRALGRREGGDTWVFWDVGVTVPLKRGADHPQTILTPIFSPEFQKASAGTNSVWAPQYGPLYSGHIPAPDYQHNVYIPGTPTLLSSKDGPLVPGRESKNSFSTFGKKKKMTTYYDMPDSVVINNDLK